MTALIRRTFARFIIVLAGAALLAGCEKAPAFKNLDITGNTQFGSNFSLPDTTGKARTLGDFKDKAVVLFFGYTHCPDVCPTTLAELSQALQQLGPDAKRVQVLMVTVDPARDTPELMKTYLSSFDPRIVGLSGTEEEIAAAARAYKIYYRKVPAEGQDYTMDHSATLFLMDGKGEFYGTSNFQEPEETRRSKLRQLIKNG